ncbi:MAG: hypothetical protein Q7K03_06890 [Dehalococcoidia bacterium]|nr:hypothetical protein [Dehalococcoidia bacterium]
MLGFWKGFLGVILVGSALLVSVACEGATQAQLEGILQNVDSISGEVTVTLKDGGTVTFNLKDVNVETLRQAAGSASLEPGTQVTLETDKDKKVKTVKARHAEVEGIIRSLDKEKKTLTVSSGEDGDTTLELTETTKIEIDDNKAATFDSLREGQEVEVKYDVETKKALKIEVDEEEDETELEGDITAVNQDAKTVTIRAKNGTVTVYRVTASTKLELDGVATFEGLKAGMKVEAKVNGASNELIKLELKD